MSYTVYLERGAEKDLRPLPTDALQRIRTALRELKETPRPGGAVRLKGTRLPGFRIRVGEYRILYTIDDENQAVYVYRIRHRREVYR